MRKPPAKTLTPAEKLFCRHYLADDARDIAAAFLYSHPECRDEQEAYKRGRSLLARKGVRAELVEQQRRSADRLGISLDRILAHIAEIAFLQPALTLTEAGEVSQRFDPASVSTKDRLAALDKLMRHVGGFAKDHERAVTITHLSDHELDTRLNALLQGQSRDQLNMLLLEAGKGDPDVIDVEFTH